jgi:hypothetical protein
MDTRPLGNTSLPTRMPEESPMRNCRLVRRDPSITLIRIPSVEMRVQVNNRDGPIHMFQ